MPQTDLIAAASPPAAAISRVAIVGASGYAGQELVRLLARHPLARLTLATGSQASSAPRRLPALAQLFLAAHRIAGDDVEDGGLPSRLHVYATKCISICSRSFTKSLQNS